MLAQPVWGATTVVIATGDTITCVAVTCETREGATRITVQTPPKLYRIRTGPLSGP